jgi:hypothetical protein
MQRGNAPDLIRRRRLLAGIGAGLLSVALACPAMAQKEKKKKSDSPIEKPLANTPVLVVEAVTAPVVGPPGSRIIMTLNIDCGTVENARLVDDLMPRVYNAVIMEMNREPLGRDGRVYDRDLDGLTRRLVHQINRALQGPQVVGVYIRSLQDVPVLKPPAPRG